MREVSLRLVVKALPLATVQGVAVGDYILGGQHTSHEACEQAIEHHRKHHEKVPTLYTVEEIEIPPVNEENHHA